MRWKGCNLSFFDHFSSKTEPTGYNPPVSKLTAPFTQGGLWQRLFFSASVFTRSPLQHGRHIWRPYRVHRKYCLKPCRAAIYRGRTPAVRRRKKASPVQGEGDRLRWKGCDLSFFDHFSSRIGHAGYNPPRRRGLRIVRNPALYSGIAPSLRRSSSPKHNHFVGLCLGSLAGSPLYTRGPWCRTVSAPLYSHFFILSAVSPR